MTKTILREIIIILLLCLAILLILGILLYEYIPIAKVIPEEVTYATPEEIQKEITEEDKVEPVTYTYEVKADDLDDYKKIQEYRPGKANPFSEPVDESQSSETNNNTSGSNTSSGNNSNSGNKNTSNGNNNTSNGSNNNGNSQNTSTGFYPNKGIK